MAEVDKQQVALDVLKSLNAAVTTTKLYPPSFPQVAAAEEKAFEKATEFLNKFGSISFSLIDDEPKLCGLPVSQRTLGKRHGEDVFQQLRLLHMEHVVLEKGFSRKQFVQLLIFFTTSPQLINKEGGGRSFVVSLGLNEVFPTDYTYDVPVERADTFAESYATLREENRVLVENIHSLSNEINSETVVGQKKITALAELKRTPGALVDLIIASISDAMKGMQRSGSVFFPSSFGTILINVEKITTEVERPEIAGEAAVMAVSEFDDFGLHNLLLQNFTRGFGSLFYDRLLQSLTTNFDDVVDLMKEELSIIGENAGRSSDQYQQVARGVDKLLDTGKGKQYSVRERAKKLLQAGEKERQAKRIQAGVSAILKGDVANLRNKEVVDHIPSTIDSLISRGKDKAAATIIEKITTELIKGNSSTKEILSECLIHVGDSLINADKWGWLEKLSVPLMAWVKEADRADDVYEKTIEILVRLQKNYWNNEKDDKADDILKLFFAARVGKLEKSDEVVEIIGKVQDLSVDKSSLPDLLQRSVEEKNDLIDRRLIMQGPISARYLLNTLFEAEKTEVRLKILELLNRMGPLLPPLLLEKLKEPMPWFSKRNLLRLLADCGSEKNVPQIIDYLNHEDIRVQKEAFSCIYKLSGEDRKTNLLDALSLASGPMKEQVVKALIPLVDRQVTIEAISLLEDWKHFPEEIKDPLLSQLFTLLSKVPYKEAEEAVEGFLTLEGKGKAKELNPSIWQGAKQALRQIKIQQREHNRQQVEISVDQELPAGELSTLDQDSSVEGDSGGVLRKSSFPEEIQIQRFLTKGDAARAKKLLVDLIERAAGAKKFNEAVRLREWLIEIDPSALNDIIRSAEIIESFKSEGISDDYLQIWSSLNDKLTTEEFNEFYYAMDHMTLSEEEIIVKQGEIKPALYFVNHGRVKTYFNEKSREIFVKNIMPGEVLGVDTFFDASVWTISASTLSKCEVSILPLENIRTWANDFPSLETKLEQYCRKYANIADSIKIQASSRREFKRFQTSGDIVANILEEDGKDTGIQMRGELSDLSKGGLSFVVRISQKKNARILLGRKIRIQLPSLSSKTKVLTVDGVMRSVRSLYSMNNEYSAHIQLDEVLTDLEINNVVEACKVV